MASERQRRAPGAAPDSRAGDDYPTMSRLFYYILACLFLALTWPLRAWQGRALGAAEDDKAGDNFSTQQRDRLVPYTI